jgi:hypothetical protein
MSKSSSMYSHRPCTLSLPSCVSLHLSYKRESTQGNRVDFLLLFSPLRRSSLLPFGSYTHVRRLLLQEPRIHTPRNLGTRHSLANLYRPTTNQCKQHEQHKTERRVLLFGGLNQYKSLCPHLHNHLRLDAQSVILLVGGY